MRSTFLHFISSIFKDLVRYPLGREGVTAPGGPTFLPSAKGRVINIVGLSANNNKTENSSCLKVPDVSIQNDCILSTIPENKSKKRSKVPIPRNCPKTVQICPTDHYEQILEGFSRFLGPANSDFFVLFAVL